jgi:hypothetical protein
MILLTAAKVAREVVDEAEANVAAAGDAVGGMVERATDDVARMRENVDGAKARFEERENTEKRRKVGELIQALESRIRT